MSIVSNVRVWLGDEFVPFGKDAIHACYRKNNINFNYKIFNVFFLPIRAGKAKWRFRSYMIEELIIYILYVWMLSNKNILIRKILIFQWCFIYIIYYNMIVILLILLWIWLLLLMPYLIIVVSQHKHRSFAVWRIFWVWNFVANNQLNSIIEKNMHLMH